MDSLLQDLGSCGKFQVVLAVLASVSEVPIAISFYVEAYGTFNPGWKCLDNRTDSLDSGTNITSSDYYDDDHGNANNTNLTVRTSNDENMTMWTEYGTYSCKAFASCQEVEFNPYASTIVTEWGLTCNRGWILSTIMSLRMVGYLVSTLMVGYAGDRFGRRLPYVFSKLLIFLLNLAAVFSVSWEMYAVVNFFSGFIGSFGLLVDVIVKEYVSSNWRIKLSAVPSWTITTIITAVIGMYVRDWKIIKMISAVIGFVLFFPVLIWLPESVRWTSVNGTKEKVMDIISKIAKSNKTPMPQDEKIDSVIEKNMQEKNKPSYTVIHLFRKGYRFPTIIIAFFFFSTDLIYLSFTFGMAALPGNVFINLIIFNVCDLPVSFIAFFLADKFQRKPSMVVMFALTSLSLFGIVALDILASEEIKTYGITTLVMASKLCTFIAWVVMLTSIIELFPTVVRSTALSFRFLFSALGGVCAPYLIPTDPKTLYICYLVMAIVAAVCSGLTLFFPETKGKPLKDTWEDDVVEAKDVCKGGSGVGGIDSGVFVVDNGTKPN